MLKTPEKIMRSVAGACLTSIPALLCRFRRQCEGFALAFTLVALPFLLAVAVWIIDGSRVTNLHTDLQNAVDAMALAGARELDGRNNAITRARAAIQQLNTNNAWFGNVDGATSLGAKFNVTYNSADAAASDVQVIFLGDIPASDDTPFGPNACADSDPATTNNDCTAAGATLAEQSNHARYVRVVANTVNVETVFPLPDFANVPVSAEATATYTAAACDVTPIFICNPFEAPPSGQTNPLYGGLTFNEEFERGNLYARQFTMRNTGNSSPAPGNFGFLRTVGQGANVLADALATGSPGVCYQQEGLDTEPGANVGPVEQGMNTRLGIYAGSFKSSKNDYDYRPDFNVRMGQKQPGDCSKYNPETDPLDGMAFPTGTNETTIGGGKVSGNNWDIDLYWDISHGGYDTATVKPADDPNYSPPTAPITVTGNQPSRPPTSTVATPVPSRYDVYRYEIDNNLTGDRGPNGESGLYSDNACYSGTQQPEEDEEDARRVIFAAVLNCMELAESGELQGASTDLPAEAFVRMFMTKPVVTVGQDKEIYLEVIDVSGEGGLGTLDGFLREEAELVR